MLAENQPELRKTEREKATVQIIIVGAPKLVMMVIYKLYKLGFIEVDEWSKAKESKDRQEVTMTTRITFNL